MPPAPGPETLDQLDELLITVARIGLEHSGRMAAGSIQHHGVGRGAGLYLGAWSIRRWRALTMRVGAQYPVQTWDLCEPTNPSKSQGRRSMLITR